ncbi:MAG TPA: amylo-alpha-1,6-glucosidase [Bacteroidales bacterium]|nr:amylo-alpha-1,6-glucosidase [Bacteroidales bacterium]
MSYIKFTKDELINLEFSLSRELIRTNRAGSYASTTIIGCNTRKYHGLLVCPMDEIDGERHVLLSSLDESVIQHGAMFNLSIHKYPVIFEPKGHKYAREFFVDPIPMLIYRVGGVVLIKEQLFSVEEERIMTRYTLFEANSPTTLRFKPFLAFRSVHTLTRENMYTNKKYEKAANGISMKLYESYKPVFMQFSKEVDYVHVPHWYYNIEYIEDQKAGLDFQEDLFVPGYFEVNIERGESIIFSAGLTETDPKILNELFDKESFSRVPRSNYLNCLTNASQQFVIRNKQKYEITAGFPWFGSWGRDTFISLPGLTLINGHFDTCLKVLQTSSEKLRNGLFPNMESGEEAVYNAADAPLWYFYAVQQYLLFSNNTEAVRQNFYLKMMEIFEAYSKGTSFNIHMCDNGLIYAGADNAALTWMDVKINGIPVTQRRGFTVEINALWYNAVCFLLEFSKSVGNNEFAEKYSYLPAKIKESFTGIFWDEKKKYLADFHDNGYTDWKIRPNMIFAASLPYQVVDEDIAKSVVDVVKSHLLTPKGLRSLSPKDKDYIGTYEGNQENMDRAYHQGTVWPWLLGSFVDAYLKLHGQSGIVLAEKLFYGFEEEMTRHGIGTVSEVFDGDPPHNPGGAISQAWSVAELLRIHYTIEKMKEEQP